MTILIKGDFNSGVFSFNADPTKPSSYLDQIAGCKQGIFGWLGYAAKRNVYTRTTVGLVYVPVERAQAIINDAGEDARNRLEHKERIGKVFASVLHDRIDQTQQDYFLKQVTMNPKSFKSIPAALQKNTRFIQRAVTSNPMVCQFLQQKTDPDYMVRLLSIAWVLPYLEESVLNDVSFQEKARPWLLDRLTEHPEDFETYPESLRNSKEFVLDAVASNCEVFKGLSPTLKRDIDFLTQVVIMAWKAFPLIEEDIRMNKKFVGELLKGQAYIVQCLDDTIRKDRDFMLQAVSNNPFVYGAKDFPQEYYTDSQFKTVWESERNKGFD
jgi:hypothetical protein